MKFRCERDVLLDALTTAGRAVSSRGGSLPVLSGLLVELHGDNLRYRSIDARIVAAAAVQCAREKAQGRWLHDNDAILRAARRLEGRA